MVSQELECKQSKPVSAPAGRTKNGNQEIIPKTEEKFEKAKKIIEKFDRRPPGYSSEGLIMEFRCTEKENTLFIFMENLIERLCQLNHIGTAKNYHTALGSFKWFRDNKDVPLAVIDQMIMEDYQVYLKYTLTVIVNN